MDVASAVANAVCKSDSIFAIFFFNLTTFSCCCCSSACACSIVRRAMAAFNGGMSRDSSNFDRKNTRATHHVIPPNKQQHLTQLSWLLCCLIIISKGTSHLPRGHCGFPVDLLKKSLVTLFWVYLYIKGPYTVYNEYRKRERGHRQQRTIRSSNLYQPVVFLHALLLPLGPTERIQVGFAPIAISRADVRPKQKDSQN